MRAISHTVHRHADADIERLFDVVVAEDVLPKVLHRWGPVPAVVATTDLSGPWDTPGSARTVLLGDGSSAREQLLVWERPTRFEYRVDSFTSALGRLVSYALGSWEFNDSRGQSAFAWTYTFYSRSRAAAIPLRVFVPTAWARYMAQCADLTIQLAEDGGPRTSGYPGARQSTRSCQPVSARSRTVSTWSQRDQCASTYCSP
jgi:hypothetical protein